MIDLGVLVPAIKGWTLCVDEPECACTICVELPEWAKRLGAREKVYLALYLASKHLHLLDYRLAAAMHVYMVRNRVAVRSEILVKALGGRRGGRGGSGVCGWRRPIRVGGSAVQGNDLCTPGVEPRQAGYSKSRASKGQA